MKYNCTKHDEAALNDALSKIEFAEAGRSEAEALVEKVMAQRNHKAATLNKRWDTLDPLDDDQLSDCAQMRIEIQNLDLWLSSAPPLRRAVENFRLELVAAKPLIQQMAQPRCVAENNLSRCWWHQQLGGLEIQPLSTQIDALRRIAIEVKGALRVVLFARRGIELTAEEKRTGIVARGYGFGNRPISHEEREAGFAFE